MKLSERLVSRRARHTSDPDPPHARGDAAAPAPPAAPSPAAAMAVDPAQANVHITANAELIIDLRPSAIVGGPSITTDMPCPNCRSELRVDSLDVVARTAILSCFACGFTFSPRLRTARA